MKVSPNKKRTALKKRPRVSQVLPSQCLACGNEQGYMPREITQDIEFRGELFPLTYTHLACSECDNAILSDAQLEARIKKVVAAYQVRHGLLTAAELIAERESLGYPSRRAFFAAVPELGEATIKRLEAGQRAQDASTDLAIRSVLSSLKEAKRKERLVNLKLPEPTESETFEVSASWSTSPFGQLAKAACLTTACILPMTTSPKSSRKAGNTNTPAVQQICSC